MSKSAVQTPFLRVEVSFRDPGKDPESSQIAREIRHLLGEAESREVRVHSLRGYSLAGSDLAPIRARVTEVLVDPVLQDARLLASDEAVPDVPPGWRRFDVVRRAGVMDPAAQSVVTAFAAARVPLEAARTYRAYLIAGLSETQARRVASLLGNEVVEEIREAPGQGVAPTAPHAALPFQRREVPLLSADDAGLQRISQEGMLALSLGEMKAIQGHFRERGRDPTDVELETLAQTWSEHCKHKTLTAAVELSDRRYDNLLKDTIFRSTRQLDRDFCLSVFKDNAGVVAFDDDYAVTFKVETHNHPSALEPYGGAGTGIGGVIRDTMGTGRGARPILSTDVFCVGPLELGRDQLPRGTLPPRTILQGVVAGVRDYGNRMGIPTASGAVFIDADYRANPLVFAGNVGLIPRDKIDKQPRAGDRIFVLGGRTGRDGIHGATFSSEGLDSSAGSDTISAVQIGNPIEEKRLLDACIDARDRDLFTAITDCGAGGLSSAVGEMGEELGADVELARVPLKYAGLSAGEIWISEAQERMVLAVPPEHADELLEVCRTHQVEATDLGCFVGNGELRLTYDGTEVASLPMEFVHHGLPRLTRAATLPLGVTTPARAPVHLDVRATLLALLRTPDITSKEEIIRQYDHEVLAGSAVKPLVGCGGFGPSDACVIAPRLGHTRGIAVGCGMAPTLGSLDVYQMALHAIDEAVRNVVSVGGLFARTALLDNFAWPSVRDEEGLGSLVLACEACRDAALAWKTPFISGKDSLNNELRTDTEVIQIPRTLLISALTLVPDVTQAVTMDLKRPGNLLFLVGRAAPELGGSRVAALSGDARGSVPRVDLEAAGHLHAAVSGALQFSMAISCHDLSEGGLAVAAAEMALAGGVGARIDPGLAPRTSPDTGFAAALFGESPTRYLLEVPPEFRREFEVHFQDLPCACIGSTLAEAHLEIVAPDGPVRVPLDQLTEAFRTGLKLQQ